MTPAAFATAMRAHAERAAAAVEAEVRSAVGATPLWEVHYDAEALLCSVLAGLGYAEGVEVFKKMPRRYG